ncbi:hypothetical protein HMPREF1581_01044 [Gardnerella vaginalis JCP8108]|uniref:Uncharacterized protein n=1 Tax=Gardnerella vaginalis JCP8108 TaxID=1261066 RepID=S4GPG6_GARVA|nr:hypothetical protein HMPREF1581_01044 [Gardnerella vaginalis JCP8108]
MFFGLFVFFGFIYLWSLYARLLATFERFPNHSRIIPKLFPNHIGWFP